MAKSKKGKSPVEQMAGESKKGHSPIEVASLELGPHDLNYGDPWEGHIAKVERDQKKRARRS